MATSYAPLTPGATEFGNVGSYFGAVADNRAAGRSRILEQETFEAKLLQAVKDARAESEAKTAASRQASAGDSQVDIAKILYETQKDNRDFAYNQYKDTPDIQLKQAKLGAMGSIGQTLMSDDTAAQINALAALGNTDAAALMGMANLGRGADDNTIARMRAAVGGNFIGDTASVSVEGQKTKAMEDLYSQLILEERKAQLNPEKAGKVPQADITAVERIVDNVFLQMNPGADKDELARMKALVSPEQLAGLYQTATETLRGGGDEMGAAVAAATTLGGGSMPVYTEDPSWLPFSSPTIGPAPGRTAPVAAPTQADVQALVSNPTQEAVLAFIARYGEEAYAQIAGG